MDIFQEIQKELHDRVTALVRRPQESSTISSELVENLEHL